MSNNIRSYALVFFFWLVWLSPIIAGGTLLVLKIFFQKGFGWQEAIVSFTAAVIVAGFIQLGRVVYRLDNFVYRLDNFVYRLDNVDTLKEVFKSHIEMVDQGGVRNIYPTWSKCKEEFYKELSEAKETIEIVQTWLPDLPHSVDAIAAALRGNKNAKAAILLVNPESESGIQRYWTFTGSMLMIKKKQEIVSGTWSTPRSIVWQMFAGN